MGPNMVHQGPRQERSSATWHEARDNRIKRHWKQPFPNGQHRSPHKQYLQKAAPDSLRNYFLTAPLNRSL